MRHHRTALGFLFACTALLGVASFGGCSSSSSSPAAAAGPSVTSVVPPPKRYAEAPPLAVPASVTSIDALTIDETGGLLYAAAGALVLRTDAATGASLDAWADLSTAGVSSISTMRVLAGGDLLLATSSQVMRVRAADGTVAYRQAFTVPFGAAGFGSAADLALSPDGSTLFAVEGGSGTSGSAGGKVIHAAKLALPAEPSTTAVTPADVWELSSPFEAVPSTTSFVNASAPFVANDGSALYVAHVVLRTIFAVDPGAPHAVVAVDTDSLQRSAGSIFLGADGRLVEAANFDETVAIFQMKDARTAKLVQEIPTGGSPGAVALYRQRVFVAQGGAGPGGGFPGLPDGGFPGDAGFPGDGGFPGVPGAGGSTSSTAPPSVQVFDLTGGS